MTVRCTVHEIHICSIQPKKNNNKINEQTAKKNMINSFFFKYNSTIIHEYFQTKIGRKHEYSAWPEKTTFLYEN